MHKEIDFKS